jgi:hypothetical protein
LGDKECTQNTGGEISSETFTSKTEKCNIEKHLNKDGFEDGKWMELAQAVLKLRVKQPEN